MTQLYIIQYDTCELRRISLRNAINGYDNLTDIPEHAKRWLQSWQEQLKDLEGKPPVLAYHVGGRGNGAHAGLYTEQQLPRILGKYPKGIAMALPVAINFKQEAVLKADKDAFFYQCLQNAGVDNWDGYEFAVEEFLSVYGDEDED